MIALNKVRATSRAAAYALASKHAQAWVGFVVGPRGYRWYVNIVTSEKAA